jgi:hypothetical protein
LYRRRSTHLAGVGARGEFKIVESSNYPKNHFFNLDKGQAPKKLPVQVRFATLSGDDDASLDIRGCAIRLSNHVEVASPFDMLLNSGTNVAALHITAFGFAVFTRFLGARLFKWFIRGSRLSREALIVGRRRAPEFFSLVHYYSQTVRYWVDDGDKRWLVRYRIVPLDEDLRKNESGLPSDQDADQIWSRDRLKDEHRPSNYLREELKRRLTAGSPIQLVFQGQFHLPTSGDTLDWYNGGVDWPLFCTNAECAKAQCANPECARGQCASPDDAKGPCTHQKKAHEWRDIAQLTLTSPLSDEEAEWLRFNPANHPPSLGIPVATGMFDYRSLADSERRVIARLQEVRMLMYRIIGLPKFGNTYFSRPRKP